MSSSSSYPASATLLMDGETRAKDLRQTLIKGMARMSNGQLESLALNALNEMVDEIVLGLCFDLHRSVKTGSFGLTEEVPEKDKNPSNSSASSNLDVFGQVITTSVGLPALKKQLECVCPNCQRNLAATRFAPHLEKCMGMGRNSSRLASRRLANNNKESYREGGANEDEDDAEDEDWMEPDRAGSGFGLTKKRQRDKNSPRRNRGSKHGSKTTSGNTTPREGSVTPPTNFDQLNIEERSNLLSSICGVTSSSSSKKVCTRSTRCPAHTDAQRRDVRFRWLAPHSGAGEGVSEEQHVDIDSFTEGDTAALRESLALLSNASSPAESTISTSSNAGGSITISISGGVPRVSSSGPFKREKRGRGKKSGKNASKTGSRGATPPIMTID